jgi:uncharacterized protein
MKTVYDVLGVAPEADERAIRAAFLNRAKVYHPDISGGDPAAEEQFKRITAAHDLIKSPERRAAYDRHLCLRRQQVRRQWKTTIAGCTISAVISAGVVSVIVPNFVKSAPRGSNVNESHLTKSFAHQLEAIAGTMAEDIRTGGTASIQIPSDAAVTGQTTVDAATTPPSAEFDRTRAIETKTANSADARSIAVPPGSATTMVGGGSARYGFQIARSPAPAEVVLESAAQMAPIPQVRSPPPDPQARTMRLLVPPAAAPKSSIKLVKQIGLPANHQRTLGIAVDDPHDTNFAIVCEIAAALATGQEMARRETDLKVVPTVGRGVQMIRDVVTLPSTDMAILPVVLADRLRLGKDLGDIGNGLVSIAALFTEEVHVLAPASISNIRDLTGKAVNLGVEGSTSAILGHEIFKSLGVEVNEVNVELDTALEEMRTGHIAATFLISGKPMRYLAMRTPSTDFHLLAVPYLPVRENGYVPAFLKHDDYPHLIDAAATVETIGVGSALMAYNWPVGNERRRLLELFVQRLSAHLPELRSGTHHPKWKEIDLTARVPGWARFDLADEQLDQQR